MVHCLTDISSVVRILYLTYLFRSTPGRFIAGGDSPFRLILDPPEWFSEDVTKASLSVFAAIPPFCVFEIVSTSLRRNASFSRAGRPS